MLSLVTVFALAFSSAFGVNTHWTFPSDSSGIAYGIENRGLVIKIVRLNYTDVESCSFIFKNLTVNYETDGTQNGGAYYWHDNQLCGILLSPFSRKYIGPWVATVKTTEEPEGKKINFQVGSKEEPSIPSSRQLTVQVGDKVSEKCVAGGDGDPIYVRVYNPKKELVGEGPNVMLTIPSVRKQDEGSWTCQVLYQNQLVNNPIQINVQVVESSTLIPVTKETSDSVNLIYTLRSNLKTSCSFERPDGLMMDIPIGLVTATYSSYSEAMSDNECGISIAKPLRNEDYGTWKIIGKIIPDEYVTGFADVPFQNRSKKPSTIEAKLITNNIQIVRGSNLTIQCLARASLTYCYLKSPSGVIYNAYDENTSAQYVGAMGLAGGECKINVDGSLLNDSDTGTWICGMGVDKAYEDLQLPVEVQITGNVFTSSRSAFNGYLGTPTQIDCRSINGYGLSYCRFNRPDGFGINIGRGQTTTDSKYKYFGDGLEKGYCGLNITNLEAVDLGNWKCTTMFVGQKERAEHSSTFTLNKEEGLPVAASVFIGVGSAAGCAGVGLVGYKIFRRKRRTVTGGFNTRSLDQPTQMGTSSIDDSRSSRISRRRLHETDENLYNNPIY